MLGRQIRIKHNSVPVECTVELKRYTYKHYLLSNVVMLPPKDVLIALGCSGKTSSVSVKDI